MATNSEIFAAIAAPLDPADIKTREQGGSVIRYITRTTVEERLNSVCPDQWHFQVTPITVPSEGSKGQWVVKGTLTICGVVREEFGMNDNEDHFDPPKSAVSDAFKRCASLFGLGRELYQKSADKFSRPKPVSKPVTNVPTTGHGPNATQHWTKTQDWKQFWGYVKGELGLTEDEAHAALGVAHVKEYLGEKKQAMDLLIGYADAKAQAEADAA